MKPIDDKEETATFRAVSRDEEGRKRVEKIEVSTHNVDTLRHVEKKLVDKGVQRLERHPADGRGGIGRPPPKAGHGGKFTWEGPGEVAESLLAPAPPALDERDPNYADDEAAAQEAAQEDGDAAGTVVVVGEVEVAKVAEGREGVARLEVDPRLI